MSGIFPLIETAVAFCAAMLAASLFVSALVQLVQGVGRYRSQALIGMLRSTIHGFRVHHCDPEALAADRPGAGRETRRRVACTENAFVEDVLGDPVLHAREVKLQYQDDPERLAALIEYLHAGDLVEIATGSARRPVDEAAAAPQAASPASPAPSFMDAAAAGGAHCSTSLLLPARWVGEAAVSDPASSYATVDNFRAYVERWFSIIEGTAAQQFKARIRRLTLVLSCLLAVVFNLDGIHLIQSLYASGSGRAALERQTAELKTVATRLGVSGAPEATDAPVDRRDSSNSDLGLELQKTASILDETRIGLGWRDSWIADRWCRWHPECVTSAPRASLGQVLLDTLLWLAGVAFGCAMLALGAPFWVTTLSRLINLRNEVQARREPRDPGGPTPPTATPPSDTAGAAPGLNRARQY